MTLVQKPLPQVALAPAPSLPMESGMAFSGIAESVTGNFATRLLDVVFRRAFGGTIKITFPSVLRNPELRNDGILAYEVRGTLKRLPADHKVWLLIKDGLGKEVKPQGFKEADHHKDNGLWEGWINGAGRKRATVIAVVAPPTSRDFFAYWQKHGVLQHRREPHPERVSKA